MASNTSQNEVAQIVWNIGRYKDKDRKETNFDYDVSCFLSDYDSMGLHWHNKMDKFIEQLDDQVKIDKNHEIRKRIVDGLHEIIDIICEKLPNFNECYAGIKRYKTGSMYAGLRVGRPYEADILLETATRISDTLRVSFYEDIRSIVKEINEEKWTIHGVKQMIFIGSCLVLEYKPNGEEQKGVGVLVDLVLCHTVEGNIESRELNPQATSFLESPVKKQIDFHKYQRSREYTGFDSGYVQHQLLKQLPEHVKRAYRVTKYLLQSGLATHKPCVDVDDHKFKSVSYCLSQELSCNLYGYKPLIKSHVLQVCLLHLLIQTRDTPIAPRLTGSALTLCLTDMARTAAAAAAAAGANYTITLNDPLCVDMNEVVHILDPPDASHLLLRTNTLIKPLFDILSCRFMSHASIGARALQYHPLRNRPSDVIITVLTYLSAILKKEGEYEQYETFEGKLTDDILAIYNNHYAAVMRLNLTGFCRGALPESMAKACDDKVQIDSEDERTLYSLYCKLFEIEQRRAARDGGVQERVENTIDSKDKKMHNDLNVKSSDKPLKRKISQTEQD